MPQTCQPLAHPFSDPVREEGVRAEEPPLSPGGSSVLFNAVYKSWLSGFPRTDPPGHHCGPTQELRRVLASLGSFTIGWASLGESLPHAEPRLDGTYSTAAFSSDSLKF